MRWRRKVFRLLAVLPAWMACHSISVVAAGEQGSVDYVLLSGLWKGHFTILQRGDCGIGGGGRSDSQVRFALHVEADGSLQAGVASGRVKEIPKLSWRGQFQPDLTVSMDAPATAVCGDQRREYRLAFSGKVTEKKGKQQLELAADNPGCPEMKCVFKHVYKLKRE